MLDAGAWRATRPGAGTDLRLIDFRFFDACCIVAAGCYGLLQGPPTSRFTATPSFLRFLGLWNFKNDRREYGQGRAAGSVGGG